MLNEEKQVEQLLTNARQSLDFLRTVIDDLLFEQEKLKPDILKRVFEAQRGYKNHKSVLLNIENLLLNKKTLLSEKLSIYLAKNLRRRISVIIEDSIELDRLR